MKIVGLLLLLGLALAQAALAEKRVALVIGNSAYKHAPALANPKNDAEGIATALRRLGFDVLAGVDLDKAGMDRLLEAYERKLDGADVALFFYAGHGLQVNGRNFLVPVDAKLEREVQLNFQAVSIDLVQSLMEQTQRTNVIILDACRDNPLARSLARGMGTRSTAVGNGLAQVQGGRGTLIVYATQPGNVALDGSGKNSPFTAALLEHIETPGLEVRQVLTRVRAAVTKATGDKQLPWEATSLTGDFYFAPKVAPPAAPGATPPAPAPATVTPPAPPSPAPDQETVFWQSIQHSKNAADYKAYLARYPNGAFAELAKLRIAEIEKAAAVTPPAPPAPEKPTPAPSPGFAKRTSTVETGVWYNGPDVTNAFTNNTTAQACAARCIGRADCRGWVFHIVEKGCWLRRGLYPPTKDEKWISGVIRTTPAAVAPGQPDPQKPAPGLPRRTSTFEHGIMILLGGETKALTYKTLESAQACAELCIKTQQCAAWTINEFKMCTLLTAARNRLRDDQWTSGVIRTTPAAAPAHRSGR